MANKPRTYSVTAYPYATQFGTIEVPADVDEENVRDWIEEHFDEIDFSSPELDYCGTDFDVDIADDDEEEEEDN